MSCPRQKKRGTKARRNRLAPAAAFVCGLLLAATRCPAEEKQIGEVLSEVGISLPLAAKLPLDVSFVDHEGRTVRLADLFNSKRPVILHLVYYECPMLCKLSSDGLLRALSSVSLKPGKDFSIITLSFDPREGPDLSARARDVAMERCGKQAVEGGWQFLTGDEAAISKVCKSVGFRYSFNDKTRRYAHAAGAFVLTPDGTLSRYLSGVEFPPRDLRLALVEASAGKVGTMADHVLLLCYMYDPATGKYGFAIINSIRAAGIATVGGLAVAIVTMLRRERKRTAADEVVDEVVIEQDLSGGKA